MTCKNWFLFISITVFLLFTEIHTVFAQPEIQEIDLIGRYGLKVNAAGPLLIKADPVHNRIILANTLTSSVTIINGETHQIKNIPIQTRIPQYLKDEALFLDAQSGDAYIVGNHCLHRVRPDQNTADHYETRAQYEMAAVSSSLQKAFLVGRADTHMAIIDLESNSPKYLACFKHKESMRNLNATPPPPIRKVIYHDQSRQVCIFDGMTNTLITVSAVKEKVTNRFSLKLQRGNRIHFAGFDPQRGRLYVVIETEARKAVQAAAINLDGQVHAVTLPGNSEAVGVSLLSKSEKVIIPYDNHPVLHVVDFASGGTLHSIPLPAFGNDASAIDEEREILYIASWHYGEIDVIDLKQNRLIKRMENIGVLPHMFSMTFNSANRTLYAPLGATAVNGSHGAAVTAFHLPSFQIEKIHTGWAPVDMIQVNGAEHFLLFNSEDEFAEIFPDGTYRCHELPYLYPRQTLRADNDRIFLSYGPHQSYWPSVYIWAARNGILEIQTRKMNFDPKTVYTYPWIDRRLARLPQDMTLDSRGGLWALQNNWGTENLFLSYFKSGIHLFSPQERIYFYERVSRETTQRIIEYDSEVNRLYLVRTGEENDQPGKLMIVNPEDQKLITSVPVGITPTDLVIGKEQLYVINFDSHQITTVDRRTFRTKTIPTGQGPFRGVIADSMLFVINHLDNTLQRFGAGTDTWPIPFHGSPDQLIQSGKSLILTSRSHEKLAVLRFHIPDQQFSQLHEAGYPYGESTFDTDNSAFYMRGQFGDGLFDLTKIKVDGQNRVWISDFLSGKVWIIRPNDGSTTG